MAGNSAQLSEERLALRAMARQFFENRVGPLVETAEKTGRFPQELLAEAGELGLFGVRYPVEDGGGGGDLLDECIWIQEGAKVCAGICAGLMTQSGLGTSIVHKFGSDEQKVEFFSAVIAGKKSSAFALTEPDAGSHVLGMRTSAVEDGDGFVINGTKLYITNSPWSDFMVLAAYTDKDAGRNGISLFAVDRTTPGITINHLAKHGHHSAETGEVFLDNVHVPASRLIGERGQGYAYLMSGLEVGRITHAARSVGLARAAFEAAMEYTREREQFGKKLSDFQTMRARLARMAITLEQAERLVYSAAEAHAAGEDVALLASMAKTAAADAAVFVTTEAMHAHGGYGYMTEGKVERYVRDARLYPVTEGTNDIQLEIIYKKLAAQM